MEIIGYFSALLIGVSLGLIGGGGSILTVPILVYIFGVNPVLSTSYSLFIVGVSSIIGAISYFKKGQIHFKTAVVFAIPSLISVYLTRYYLLPYIPSTIITTDDYLLTKDTALMVLFACIMVLAAFSMIKSKKQLKEDTKEGVKFNYVGILIDGLIVGALTGLVGAGGGFLIIPALVVLAKLPMKMAVGTSLLIIAVKSLIGFVGDIGVGLNIDWLFLLTISLLAMLGILLGSFLTKYVSNKRLKKGFGWFVMIMAIIIISKEIIFK